MATRLKLGAERPGLPLGFTLVELIVVMAIIGIILVFLLIAANDARRRAEQDATLALITKLEGGVNDRLDALLQTRPDPNLAHLYMAGIYPAGYTTPMSQASTRAQVFAWYDYIKSELPDVFFVQNPDISDNSKNPYPLNFAANQFPGTSIGTDPYGLGNWMLPLGNSVANNPPPGGTDYGADNTSNLLGTGIFGASYYAAAGIYKNLGYLPAGYDGIDNNNNGAIDESLEGAPVGSPANSTVQANLNAHLHQTARAEMLYAVLVEGVGPLGSVFNRDDFTDKEVQDTDGDGLPEFVDAWGRPIQFFRWPLLYHTDTQRGQVIDYWDYTQTPPLASAVELFNPPYRSPFEAREQDPLDPNQQLTAPSWWAASTTVPGTNTHSPFADLLPGTSGSVGASGGVAAFEYFFHRITEPLATAGDPLHYWDRGTSFPSRRAFFSRPLILSSGPDKQLGVFLYPNGTVRTATQLLMVENNAMTFINDFTSSSTYVIPGLSPINPDTTSYDTNAPTSFGLRESGRDDISNQNRQATGGLGGW